MKNKFKKVLLLLGAFLLIAGNVWGLPMDHGDTVMMTSSEYRESGFSGGEFVMTVVDQGSQPEARLVGPGSLGDAYMAFCVERDEYISLRSGSNVYTVESVEEYATNGGNGGDHNQDPLSDESKWLYASYMNGFFGDRSAGLARQVQNAIWYKENEILDPTDWNTLDAMNLGNNYSVAGWDIQVVNLLTMNGGAAQSQIVGTAAPVPEPATMLLLGTGLIGMAGIGRRKFKK